MNSNIEKEYKILVSEKQFELIASQYPNLEYHKQVNTYYDTDDQAIASLHGAMRIRKIHNSYIFTMKLLKGNDLYEYECPVDKNDSSVFAYPEITKLLQDHHLQGEFHEVTSLTTYRAMVCSEDAELCFDKNYYHGSLDYEIEYEYKRQHDGLPIFQKILAPANITYEKNCVSKIQRALRSLHD